MSRKNSDLVLLFKEDFTTDQAGLPGAWYVEQESDMPHVPAIESGEDCINFLSAGNKYVPVIPDTNDARVDFTFSVNYSHFAFFINVKWWFFIKPNKVK